MKPLRSGRVGREFWGEFTAFLVPPGGGGLVGPGDGSDGPCSAFVPESSLAHPGCVVY